ncbi:hypothetical protein EJ903_16490 [Azospirillum griseum]|uniref:Surface antigen n=2 Tax=Azospirillum griseum TaxID=2496639 RepID=A0A431VFB8_9PROT|nr:hypothetical protein EJ903_16490 [Azospirillum griseum]
MKALRRSLGLGAMGVAALLALVPVQALARGSVTVDIGIGGYYPAYPYPHHHRHSYYPPPPMVVYPAPPVVVYEPPPRVIYAPPPVQVRNTAQCREYQSTVMVGGRPQSSYGTACLQPDGTWRIVD